MESPIRVLLVDEDVDVLDVTKTFLESENDDFAVTTATGAEEALELVEQERFDAVVTDYRMPDVDGLSFAESVDDVGTDVPVVLFTAYRGTDLDSAVAEAELAGYVEKRTGTEQYDELAGAIREALAE
jgi:DNA-binding NtrC family response regulator